MGMAASQARYLALVARKSNCEYEGQQINQARLNLSNQSANLFNQMLGLNVPIPPSTQDFTKTQYSYTDGLNASTITSWKQIAGDPQYNYVVTHHYYTDKYTGSQKMMTDPQVVFSGTSPAGIESLDNALKELNSKKATYDNEVVKLTELKNKAKDLNTFKTTLTESSATQIKDASGNITGYTIEDKNGTVTNTFNKIVDTNVPAELQTALNELIKNGAVKESEFKDSAGNWNCGKIFYDSTKKQFAYVSDLGAMGEDVHTLPVYSLGESTTPADNTILGLQNKIAAQNNNVVKAQGEYETAKVNYEKLSRPTSIGNCKLTQIPSGGLTSDQKAEIEQILKDMEAQGIKTNIPRCFTSGEYTGGLYSFEVNGTTYYTTYYDLYESHTQELLNQNNKIDGQVKMPYYNASYVSTKIEETNKALVETDGNGRFTSIKFDNDSVKYTLNMETITDDAAYQDAMNQYYYENAKYDKTVQDINAKTSIIQREDQQLELRLKQLDTEQNALAKEIEAVSKVVKDNVEKSFNTFGG